MKASHLFGSILLIIAVVLHAAAQDGGCSLTIKQSPQIRGLRLGMTVAQVSALYPRLPVGQTNEFGQIRTSFNAKRVDEVAFADVLSISLDFIDDRLVAFSVDYDQVPWDNLDQFVARLSELLKLPGGWADTGVEKRLSCDEFQIEAGTRSSSSSGIGTYVRIRQLGAEDVITKRVAEIRERRRRAFKP